MSVGDSCKLAADLNAYIAQYFLRHSKALLHSAAGTILQHKNLYLLPWSSCARRLHSTAVNWWRLRVSILFARNLEAALYPRRHVVKDIAFAQLPPIVAPYPKIDLVEAERVGESGEG